MKKFKRIFLIVMDSFGAGHAKTGLLTAMTVQIPWVILLRSMITGKSQTLQSWGWRIYIFKGSNTWGTSIGLSAGP